MRAFVAYVVASAIAIALLTVGLVNANHRADALERQLAAATRTSGSPAAGIQITRSDLDRAEAGYQESKRFAADIVYAACRSQGGSRASCAKQQSK